MPTALVTGASRGLGLEWVRQLLADGWQVTATCRDPSRAHALGAVTEQHPEQAAITALDVDDPADVRAAVARVGQRVEGLDLVVSNAGIWADPARESEASAGPLARATFVACHAYQVSKAALNMATRLLAVELADDDITVVALDPGWVRTELGGAGARLDPEESVAGLRGVVASLSREQSGQVLNRRGEPVAF